MTNDRLRQTASGRERVATLHDCDGCTLSGRFDDLLARIGRIESSQVDTGRELGRLSGLIESALRPAQRRLSGPFSVAPREGEIDIRKGDTRIRGGTWAILAAVVVVTVGGCTALIGRAYVSREIGQTTAGK